MVVSSEPAVVPCPIPTDKPAPDGFPDYLPPWRPQAESWWILTAAPLPWQTKALPKGALDNHESIRLQDFQATYEGGPGAIQLIRYHESPVGPYDELIYVPGQMSYKSGDSSVSGRSITRIYVSSFAPLTNGRRIWNTPKHLARFEFIREAPSDPLSPTLVSVYPSLSDSPTPEFSPDPCSEPVGTFTLLAQNPLQPIQLSACVTRYRVLQPPLSEPMGTEKWITVEVENEGYIKIMYPEPGLIGGRYGDGIGCPDIEPMSIGLWCPKASVHLFTHIGTPLTQNLVGPSLSSPEILDLISHEPKKIK
ncbi:hypothetical protein RhiXN_05717 [Rhizoctonia solani]|uniref:Uncharacterized protein n=1 Tax=Rhizoctonia solani TaxID=456999 RepID=A0A8H8SXW5_9AGAM|nr:uncharacterized protein RhiXN_05717 [Rhizoctonia solani]QRW20728.1 hypothetical protein RhiXN_05717 [Rhizoctonia solani]